MKVYADSPEAASWSSTKPFLSTRAGRRVISMGGAVGGAVATAAVGRVAAVVRKYGAAVVARELAQAGLEAAAVAAPVVAAGGVAALAIRILQDNIAQGLDATGWREELRKNFLYSWHLAEKKIGRTLTPKEIKPLHDEYMRWVAYYAAHNPATRHGGGLD